MGPWHCAHQARSFVLVVPCSRSGGSRARSSRENSRPFCTTRDPVSKHIKLRQKAQVSLGGTQWPPCPTLGPLGVGNCAHIAYRGLCLGDTPLRSKGQRSWSLTLVQLPQPAWGKLCNSLEPECSSKFRQNSGIDIPSSVRNCLQTERWVKCEAIPSSQGDFTWRVV